VAVVRFAAVLLIALLCAEVSLQQPPGGLRRTPPDATELAASANELYRAAQWSAAAEKYEAAIAAEPALASAYFFLANSYDHLYTASRSDDDVSDGDLRKAVRYYQLAFERDPDPKIRRLALEYLVAACGPEKLNDPVRAAPLIQRMIDLEPGDVRNYFALAKVYEDTGRYDDAERVLATARGVKPADLEVYRRLAGYYNRQGNFAKTMEALADLADLDAANPAAQNLVATYYWEKAQKDFKLTSDAKLDYILKGLEAGNRALALDPDFVEALTYKNLLLRMQAGLTADPPARDSLIAEADALRDRAIELNRLRRPRRGARSPGPPR